MKLKCLSDVEHANENEEEQGLEVFFSSLNHDLTCLNDHFLSKVGGFTAFFCKQNTETYKEEISILIKTN